MDLERPQRKIFLMIKRQVKSSPRGEPQSWRSSSSSRRGTTIMTEQKAKAVSHGILKPRRTTNRTTPREVFRNSR